MDTMKANGNEPTEIFWTGGWDSTFQVLRLLLERNRRVRPYYLIDASRSSTLLEIQAMDSIRASLFREFTWTRERLEPTQFCSVADIPQDEEIARAFQMIRARRHMGGQYDWLARFCKHRNLSGVELSILQNERANADHFCLRAYMSEADEAGDHAWRIAPRYAHTPEYRLFRYYTFPLFGFGKMDMRNIVASKGWDPFMNSTWFCHRPGRRRQPCGTCNPCLMTFREGMGYRMSPLSRLKARIAGEFVAPLRKKARDMLTS